MAFDENYGSAYVMMSNLYADAYADRGWVKRIHIMMISNLYVDDYADRWWLKWIRIVMMANLYADAYADKGWVMRIHIVKEMAEIFQYVSTSSVRKMLF